MFMELHTRESTEPSPQLIFFHWCQESSAAAYNSKPTATQKGDILWKEQPSRLQVEAIQ